jgi:ankyrin repeat protein
MKTYPQSFRAAWLLILFLGTGPSISVRAEDEIEKAFRDALYAEEIQGDSEVALKAYKEVGAKFEMQRDLAATALFRQGECLRKLGRKDEAVAAYNKVLAQYGDRERVAKLSRENLTALGIGIPAPDTSKPPPAAPLDDEEQDITRLKTLAENSPDLLAQGELESAASQGRAKVVAWLLEKLPKQSPQTLAPALLSACTGGHLRVCERLLDAGADPNGSGGRPPVWAALEFNRPAVMKLLLARKANINARWDLPFQENLFTTLAPLPPPNDPFPDSGGGRSFAIKGATPLMAAVADLKTSTLTGTDGKVSAEIFDAILKSGADVNAVAQATGNSSSVTGPDGQTKIVPGYGFPCTALGIAIDRHRTDKVRALLAAGADAKKAIGDRACPPLLLALATMDLKEPADSQGVIAQLLLDSGADWKGSLATGANALHICARRGLHSLLEKGIKAGVDVNAEDQEGFTPLHNAVKASSAPCVRLLLAAGAKVDPVAKTGSPLLLACSPEKRDADAVEVLKCLLDAGADPNRKKEGPVPLNQVSGPWYYSQEFWPEAIQLLIAHGARPAESNLLSFEAWHWHELTHPVIEEARREAFRSVWKAAHWRDNARLSHAVWISQGESVIPFGKAPAFNAVLCDAAAVLRPPAIREFFRTAPRLSPEPSSGGTLIPDWSGVSIIRLQDGKEERIPVNVSELAAKPEKSDMALLWGDVVELPVKWMKEGEVDKQREETERWIYAAMPADFEVQVAPGRFVSNVTSASGKTYRATAGKGIPFATDQDVIRGAGIPEMLYDGYAVQRTSSEGVLGTANRTSPNIATGDILQMQPPGSEAKLSDEAQFSALWLCQSPEGPFWHVPLQKTLDDKPAPLAGLLVALLAPHPLPSACFDWEKATVRYFNAPKKETADPPKKGEPATPNGWVEKKLLEAWPTLRMERGMVITLPSAERDSYEPPAKLRASLTAALAQDWKLTAGQQPEMECRYEPRFFRGEKKNGAWIWRDLDPKKANGPVLPVIDDVVAANPRAGYPVPTPGFTVSYPVENGTYARQQPDAHGRWLSGPGSKVEVHVE